MALAQSTSQLMPLYDLLLMRLEPLPLTVASLNALDPLLTAIFSRIPLLAAGSGRVLALLPYRTWPYCRATYRIQR